MTDDHSIPAEVLAVIELFSSPALAKVTFPDVDAGSLKRDADELRAEVANVERARAALATAEAARDRRQAALVETATRAVAYARIYSEAHPEKQPLATALANLTTPPTAEPKPPGKRRGRPPRQSAELFGPPVATDA